jgi:hypothetical protein
VSGEDQTFDEEIEAPDFESGGDGAGLGARSRPRPHRRVRLRRSPLGTRTVDVRDQFDAIRDELDDRQDDIDELRNDVAALWLAFGQHERAIRELIAAVEALGGAQVSWPGQSEHGSQMPIQPEALPGMPPPPQLDPPGSALDRETIAAQLAGLDDVLAAIDQATRSLETVYAEEIPATQQEARPAGS